MAWWKSFKQAFRRGEPSADEPARTCPYCGAKLHPDALDCWSCHRNISGPNTVSNEQRQWFDQAGQ